MLKDVFYFGNKPNAHPREKHALNLADARRQCTTEHFWIINEYCDYRKFDWAFDFEFLPDEDVWAQEHINIWPSQHQKDSGTWLCNTDNTLPLMIYRADVEPIRRRNEKNDIWVINDLVDETKFDFSWHPDPTDPPFIYKWGCKYYPVEIKHVLEYAVPNATNVKYMSSDVALLPDWDRWEIADVVDKSTFDFNWRPDPREPEFIYTWGCKYYPVEIKHVLTYRMPEATNVKYMSSDVSLLPDWDNWNIVDDIDKNTFDFSWRPDPTSPPYIYGWGNQWNKPEDKISVTYTVAGASQYKYMEERVTRNQCMDNWVVPPNIDKKTFDFSWHPGIEDKPYIYQFGTQWQKTGGPTYIISGATDIKYIDVIKATALSTKDNWIIYHSVVDHQLSWHPDETEQPYIYTWGNKYVPAEIEPTLEYTVPGAIERKYMGIVDVVPQEDRWKIFTPVDKTMFDFSWRPDPREPDYIYVWGNKYIPAELQSTLEYIVPGATERKYMGDAVVEPEWDKWKILIPVEQSSFEFTWRPDPREPAYIYVFGNKWNDATTEPTLEYWVKDATERKYMVDPVAITKTELSYWHVSNNDDLETFDFSWRPNPHSPPQIYQWADNGPRYTVPGATEVVLMERTEETLQLNRKAVNRYKLKTTLEELIAEHPDEVFWVINPDLNYDKFDFNWKPNSENFRHINVFGNEYSKNTQTYYVNGPLYMMGHKEFNYVEEQKVQIDSNLSMFFVDKNNSESKFRFEQLQKRYPKIQKTRYLNSWVDTINRCINKSETELCWILNSELDYTDFTFDYYPSPWQMKMVHVFGTQWSHWGTTFVVNKETFSEDTKYVKIIEHLNNLNFVKTKRAVARNCLYDVYLIDYGNANNITALLENKTKRNVEVIKYEGDYLTTLKNMLYELGIKKDHYIWVCSSICDYGSFDFTYICDPFANEQLHVFPSDLQKFGDTFFINVNKLRTLVEDLDKLENIEKINFNQHQRVKRLPAPNFITESDTHVSIATTDFDWPYATFITADNKEINVIDHEPISLWSADTKNILITSTGGTHIVVPKEAKEYVKNELYDYPYIAKSNKLATSQPLDIVFLSNGETGADENYEHLLKVTKGLRNRVVRVDGINGRVAAYHAAAEASNTPWMFTVFAKLRINSKFDFSWQPDRLQIPKHYIFYASNPVNGLVYGHQGLICYNKKLTLNNLGYGLDFTLDDEHEVIEINSGVALYNTDACATWRTAFREVIKLKDQVVKNPKDKESASRLYTWLNVGYGDFSKWSNLGAADAEYYYGEVSGDYNKLNLSYEWAWLTARFNSLYDEKINP